MAVVFLGGGLAVSGAFAQGSKVNFEKQILPFLKNSCVECHRAPYEKDGKVKKPKGGLRLDAAWAITLGSEDGEVVDVGKAEESALYTSVMLPADDDDVMPPEGKADALTEAQKQLLKKWIDEGADFGGWAGNLTGKPKGVTNAGGKMPVSEIQEVYKKLAMGLKPLAEDDWKAVVDAGGHVSPLSEGGPLLEVDFRHAGKVVSEASLSCLVDLGSHVAVLDLSKTEVGDAGLKRLAKFERLVKLDLHGTAVTGAGLKSLQGLKHLRYLNLYGSQVADEGLQLLGKMKSLKEVYLWDSKVSAKGVKRLKQALPGVEVSWE
ncbi:MAG: hypothetical protein L3J39_12950 [Verrucomicrobiales bacterium]|nr:hypothetical protein [Verrucomicrobiales bacterium]